MRASIPLTGRVLVTAILSVTACDAFAGGIVSGWPDAIICKKQETISDVTTIYQIPLYLSQEGLVQGKGAYVVTYLSVHFHEADGRVNNQYFMLFVGPSPDQAIAEAVPSDMIDCPPGITIAKLRAQGQTRDFVQ